MIKLVYGLDGARKTQISASQYELVAECFQYVAYLPRFNNFSYSQSEKKKKKKNNEVDF